MVGAVHASRVVDGIGVDPASQERVFDAPLLGEAKIATFGDHATAHLSPVHAQRIISFVADIAVALITGLHISADAPVPQEVHRGLQQCADKFVRRQYLGLHCQSAPDFGRQGNGFGAPGEDSTPLRDNAVVVVGPGGTWQLEEPLPLLEAALRIGVRVEKDVLMIERANQLYMPGEQHAVAEHIAGHVADPYDGEIGRLHIHTQFAAMPLDRLPGPSGGNTHLLVIVACGAT